MKSSKIFLKYALLFLVVVYAVPAVVQGSRYLIEKRLPSKQHAEVAVADMSSIGLLGDPLENSSPRVVVFSVPISGWEGRIFSHSWIVFKNQDDPTWSRYEVLGYAGRDYWGERNPSWLGSKPALNRYSPDGRWFGKPPVVLANVQGSVAAAIIPRIKLAIENYEQQLGHYRSWPGPNSNTFIAYLLRTAPELRAALPTTAMGRDFKPGVFLGLSDSRTGIEVNVLGMLGLKIAWIEGVELNLLGGVAGFDFRAPAIKIPLFGRIELNPHEYSLQPPCEPAIAAPLQKQTLLR